MKRQLKQNAQRSRSIEKRVDGWAYLALLCAGFSTSARAATDNKAPTTVLTEPVAGSAVKGVTRLTATAQDNVKVAAVQFYLDGKKYGNDEHVAPYQIAFDTTKIANGKHSIASRAIDTSGKSSWSSLVSFNVANGDTTAPRAQVSEPAANATLTGKSRLTAVASDNVGIAGVQFLVDGKAYGNEEHYAPYQIPFDTTKLSPGSHTVAAKARDAAGNVTSSAVLSFKVVSVEAPAPLPPVSQPPSNLESAYQDDMCKGVALDGWSRDAQGWTRFADPASLGGRKIYVTQAGGSSDAARGIYYVKTAAEGLALLRKGNPDAIYFHRGETFSLSMISDSKLGGRSQSAPMLISSYGTGLRPILKTGTAAFLQAWHPVSHLALVGLDLRPATTSSHGIAFQYSVVAHPGWMSQNILIEDVRIKGFVNNLIFESMPGIGFSNIVVRRSQILDSMGSDHSQGIYAAGVRAFKVEENVLDHNGFRNRNDSGQWGASIFAHNAYLQSTNQCLVFSRNLSSQAASHGLQARAGGVIEDNLFARDPLGMSWGHVNGGSVDLKHIPHGVSGRIVNNVVFEATDIRNSLPRDGGIDVGNAKKLLIDGNILAKHLRGSVAGTGITFSAEMGMGLHNMRVQNNLTYDLAGALIFSGRGFGDVTVRSDGSVVDASGAIVISAAKSGLMVPFSTYSMNDTGNVFENNMYQKVSRSLVTGYGGYTQFARDFTHESNVYDCNQSNPANCSMFGTPQSWASRVQERNAQIYEMKFVDPDRNFASYLESLDSRWANLSEDQAFQIFVDRFRNMERSTWDARFTSSAFNDYLRDGFRKR